MEKAIVTGANGFLGTHLCTELTSRGVCVYAVVQPGTDVTDLLKNPLVRLVYCDFAEYAAMDKVLAVEHADVMIHLAWKGTSGNIRGDYCSQIDNITAACQALECCKKLNVKRFVFASSIMEYEIAKAMEISEAPAISTLYSTAKLSANYMLRALAGELGICYVRALISNIYGPKEMSPRLVNTTIRKLLKGEHCSFSAGTQMYDFIYVDDAINKIIAVAQKGKNQHSYYIGSENPKPLREFLAEIRDVVAPNAELGLGELPFHGVTLSYHEFDIHAVKRDTGVENRILFKEGIGRTCAWIKGTITPGYRFDELELKGAYLISNFSVGDNRGGFTKSFEKDIFAANGIAFSVNETFVSTSSKNVIRGLHFQTHGPQAKLVSVVNGSVYDVIVDLRKDSPTFGQWRGYYLNAKEHNALYVPRGFAHGFLSLEDNTQMMYQCDGAYDKESDTGIRFDDPNVGIVWPVADMKNVICSERDAKLQSFTDYCAKL